jgi:predicted DCC family thiol-disulfide oxidoreductase YuxK
MNNNLPTKNEALERVKTIEPVLSGWPQIVLMIAGLYNFLFGAWAIFFPKQYLNFTNINLSAEPLWQCIGMIVGLYGLGYFIASTNICKYWPLVLIGFLGKIFGPIGFVWHILIGTLDASGLILILFNDLIWLIPFAIILLKVFHLNWKHQNNLFFNEKEVIINEAYNLLEKHDHQKLIFIFIRHIGCSFSKLLLESLNKEYNALDSNSYKICLISMSNKDKINNYLSEELKDKILFISDPKQYLYQFFKIKRGSIFSVINLNVIKESFKILRNKSCHPGFLDGDGFQLSGLVLIENYKILKKQIHQTVLTNGSILEQIKVENNLVVPKLFFDGDCPLCKREIAFLKSLIPKNKFEFIDLVLYKNTAKETFNKTYDELMREIHAKDEHDNWLIGMDAFRLVYSYTPYKTVFNLSKLPLIKQTLDLGYKFFAKNRLKLTGRHCRDNVCN